ncbi:alpha-S2-casein-like A isoform X4 [Mesocricetus auratus]|uniref:Alpha-S2-casein-like A isoform X4 n=1 Tax=Mesocricetus auratus TaxID=10036 RepID=A0ABM2XIE4_MESAU|nr:alpha-S2-casein-like A isoform X4 [Mesocricetus auratus]
MKFFIFTCLVAVAMAKQVIKDQSSSEKHKQGSNVFFQTNQDSAISSSSEESSEEINEKKVKQFSQDFSCLQSCIPVSQQQTVMNQWVQGKAIHNIPNQESISIIVEEILKKIIDMVKNSQIYQFNTPQFLQAVHQQQTPVIYWNKHSLPYAPYVV